MDTFKTILLVERRKWKRRNTLRETPEVYVWLRARDMGMSNQCEEAFMTIKVNNK